MCEEIEKSMEEEKQTYKFMDCPTCGKDKRFISTLSPKGSWVCCQCGTKVSDKPWKLDFKSGDYKIK